MQTNTTNIRNSSCIVSISFIHLQQSAMRFSFNITSQFGSITYIPSIDVRTYYRFQILTLLAKIIQNSLYTHSPHTFTPNCSKFWFWNTDFCNNLTIFTDIFAAQSRMTYGPWSYVICAQDTKCAYPGSQLLIVLLDGLCQDCQWRVEISTNGILAVICNMRFCYA
jgi:hypothetical protein